MTATESRLEVAPESLLDSVTRGRLLTGIAAVRHGITGRVPGLGRSEGNVGYSPPRDQEDAWAMRRAWCEAIGLDPDRIATLGQVHGAEVHRVGGADAGRGARPGSGRVGLGDALITDEPGVVLMTLHADCLPILLVDPDRPAVAAIHAGWRGTVADVAGATVRAMASAYGSRPERLVAFFGPAIGPCCYKVGQDVADAWLGGAARAATDALTPAGDRWRFDLRRANHDLLFRAGLDPANLEVSLVCTRCAGERWFSHRGQGPAAGRFGALIALAR